MDTRNHCVCQSKNLVELHKAHLYKGGSPSPHHNTKNYCLCIRNHCVGQLCCKTTRNHWVCQFIWKKSWKTTLRPLCLSRVPPLPPLHNTNNHNMGIRKYRLCQFTCKNYTDPLCGSIHLKRLLENISKSPRVSPSSPRTINNHCVGIWNHCLVHPNYINTHSCSRSHTVSKSMQKYAIDIGGLRESQ